MDLDLKQLQLSSKTGDFVTDFIIAETPDASMASLSPLSYPVSTLTLREFICINELLRAEVRCAIVNPVGDGIIARRLARINFRENDKIQAHLKGGFERVLSFDYADEHRLREDLSDVFADCRGLIARDELELFVLTDKSQFAQLLEDHRSNLAAAGCVLQASDTIREQLAALKTLEGELKCAVVCNASSLLDGDDPSALYEVAHTLEEMIEGSQARLALDHLIVRPLHADELQGSTTEQQTSETQPEQSESS